MPGKIAVNELGEVQKTLFLPLWGRAVETKKEKPLLVDKKAVEIIEKIDYDFSGIAQNTHGLTQLAWIMRSLCVDEVIHAFLSENPMGTIVNIGCGLDTTFERVDNGLVVWDDLDLPDVIDLRRKFTQESDRRRFVACSFLNEKWLDEVCGEEKVLFIAAGVFYYFEEGQIKRFLIRLADKVPGCEILFDVSSPRGVSVANKKVIESSGLGEKSYLKWGLESPSTITGWDQRFHILNTYYYFGKRARSLKLKTRLLGWLSDYLKIQYMIHLEMLA